jgi:uroporphyrinogen-III decarboxylase
VEPGTGNRWTVQHFCSSAEDAHQVLEALERAEPDSKQPVVRDTVASDSEEFNRQVDLLGDRGAHWVTIPSPVLPVVRLFPPDEFLIVMRTEPELVDELIEAVTGRILARLTGLLEAGVGPIIRLGGEEHFTPPLAAPSDFDRFVVPADSRIVELCHAYGRFAAVHCHGRLSHALRRFVEIGFDQTDPTEVAPDGDLDIEAIKAIAGEAITLTGNIQMRELFTETPASIVTRVRRLVHAAGPARLVIGTTGTPLAPIPPAVETNYHALLDAVLQHGGVSG